MKAFLLYKDRDFNLDEQPWNAEALIQDLELHTLFDAMSHGDKFIREVVEKVVLSSLHDPEAILYRQVILEDCLSYPAMVRDLYGIAVRAVEAERKSYFGAFLRESADWIVYRSREVLGLFAASLKELRAIADAHAGEVHSDGLRRLFTMLQSQLDDEYLARVQAHLKQLQFRDGVLISAQLGKGNEGAEYILRRLKRERQGFVERLVSKRGSVYTFRVPEHDENGARILTELKDRGLNLVANALAQATDHILSFFTMLRTELAFYVGCVALRERLAELGQPTCFPVPVGLHEREHAFAGLYDACLVLTMGHGVVANDLDARGKELAIITGANHGGKSTFLRSIGLAQVMMQCGMFAPAQSFRANVCGGLFTHFKREEDTAMESGKLDEEFSRMNAIADHVAADGMVLFNESFAATNEREGSEIARQITCALVERRVKVFFVSHLYEFAHSLCELNMENAVFMRADRGLDGRRTFKIIQGDPLETSYGKDLYDRIFGAVSEQT